MRQSISGTELLKMFNRQNKLSFHEWLFEYRNFDKDDIEHLLSSDELDELYEEYQDWILERITS